jgi:hypothetical protein
MQRPTWSPCRLGARPPFCDRRTPPLPVASIRERSVSVWSETWPSRARETMDSRPSSRKLADLGIAFVVLPHLPGTHLDGAAMLRSDGVPAIALTLRKDRIDNFWFTFLHELAHVKSHLVSGTQVIFDDLELGSSQDIEQEADEMARIALIPDELWAIFNSDTYVSMAEVFDFAQRAEVSPDDRRGLVAAAKPRLSEVFQTAGPRRGETGSGWPGVQRLGSVAGHANIRPDCPL